MYSVRQHINELFSLDIRFGHDNAWWGRRIHRVGFVAALETQSERHSLLVSLAPAAQRQLALGVGPQRE